MKKRRGAWRECELKSVPVMRDGGLAQGSNLAWFPSLKK
jgi:hypothetical protein